MVSATALLICLVAVLTITSVTVPEVHGCVINVVNRCPYRVTACAQSANNPINQYNLGSGGRQRLDFGSACQWPAGTIWASVTGRCAAPGNPSASTDRNLANLAEFTLGSSVGDIYDISNVNAYTIALRIAVTNRVGEDMEMLGTTRCGSITCDIADIRSFCRGNNRLVTHSTGALSCVNTDGTNGIGPTSNTRLFKNACPDAYSYNFDDPTSTFGCGTGSTYEVTFCPNGRITSATDQSHVDH